MNQNLRAALGPLLVLALLAAAVFGPALGHEFLINWDDASYVTNNDLVKGLTLEHVRQAFSRFFVGNYAPLHIVSYMIDHALWGMRPLGFIFDNILLHLGSGLIFYLVLMRLGLVRSAALAATALFLVHPVQVESVVWISQRKNVLAMFFYLLALLLYLRYREPGNPHRQWAYGGSIGCFALALLAKSVAVVLPGALLLYDLCWLRERRPKVLLLDKVPYLLVAIAFGYVALLSQSPAYGGGGRATYHGGTAFATLLTMLPVLVDYTRLVLWPVSLSVVYAPPIKTFIDGQVLVAALILALLVGLGAYLFRRDRRFFFWYAAIPLGLLPVAQIVPLVTLMNDRYLYFPMLGVAACSGLLCAKVLDRTARRWHAVVLSLVWLVVAAYAYGAQQRSRVWQSSQSLWQDAVAKQPASYAAWYSLGEVYQEQGRVQEALRCQETAKTLCVGCRGPLLKLGGLYLMDNDLIKAQSTIEELFRYYPNDPEAYQLQGHLAYQQGDLTQAEAAYRQSLTLKPDLASSLVALGNVYLGAGRPAAALEQYRRAVAQGKRTADLEYSLACAESLLGNRAAALEHLATALRLGYARRELILQNKELDSLRGEPRYTQLIQTYFGERSK